MVIIKSYDSHHKCIISYNIQLEMFNHALIDATYRENGKKCQLTLAKAPISFFAPIVIPLAKNGPYTKAVSEA